jgi:hypothetical protein
MAQGHVSTENTTTTPLGLTAIYPGAYFQCQHWGSVQVSILSDIASISNGVKFIWSDDGITDRVTDDVYTYALTDDDGNAITSAQTYVSGIKGNYFRLEFEKSGAANQTVFRVDTTFREIGPWAKGRRLSDRLQDRDYGQVTTSQVARYGHTQIATSTPLGGGATFATGVQSGRDYNSVALTIFSDVNSAANGVEVRFYGDSTNVDETVLYTYTAGVAFSKVLPMLSRSFSVHFTNGAGAQSIFRLNIFRNVAAYNSHMFNIGHPGDTAWASGSGSLIAIAKAIAAGGSASAAGTIAQVIKTVAATGTPEAIAATATLFKMATLIGVKAARTNNTGIVYVGASATNDTQPLAVSPGERVSLEAPPGQKLDLAAIYVDVLNAGDGVAVLYS